jgi:hypothetical protein
MFVDLNYIVIDNREDICSVCSKRYPHSKRFLNGYKDGDKTIKEVTLITAHAGCRNLVDRLKKAKEAVLDLEYKLFEIQINSA